MGDFKIAFYTTEQGRCPIVEFLDDLDIKLRAKTVRTIELLEEYGNNLKAPYTSSLGDGLFELRTIHGTNITRIIYFFVIEKQIILTNGFVKKSQKTPVDEIYRAKKYREKFIQRKEKSYE